MDLEHKSNRKLSSSAKWAENKHLALEYLKRQREFVEWMQAKMDQTFETHDLHLLLRSGVLLRELMYKLAPTQSSRKPIARTYSVAMAPWKERENISVFLADCKRLGMSECSLFGTDDLYEGSNMVQVVFSLHYIKAWFSGGVRSPRSLHQAAASVHWEFSESQVADVMAHFQRHKSQELLLQGYIANPNAIRNAEPIENQHEESEMVETREGTTKEHEPDATDSSIQALETELEQSPAETTSTEQTKQEKAQVIASPEEETPTMPASNSQTELDTTPLLPSCQEDAEAYTTTLESEDAPESIQTPFVEIFTPPSLQEPSIAPPVAPTTAEVTKPTPIVPTTTKTAEPSVKVEQTHQNCVQIQVSKAADDAEDDVPRATCSDRCCCHVM
ncbi:hypothetical protein AeNC1_013354 [Aphanomyces euteiches]|nr:hypothetical protein AeNC1_013354 [Aphanomyces euteiches]